MDAIDSNPDTTMVVAGVALSLLAALELYPAWKRTRTGSHGASGRGDGRSTADE
jgi:hypothetical protein